MSELTDTLLGFYSLSDDYAGLERTGLLDSFNKWLSQVVDSNLSSNNPKTFYTNLKIILNDLVDQRISDSKPTAPSPRVSQSSPKRPESVKLNSKSTSKAHKLNSTTKPKTYSKIPKSYSVMQKPENVFKEPLIAGEELMSFSDFYEVKGAATFGRDKRKMGNILNKVPGPNAYTPNAELLRTASPASKIPVGGKRMDFAKSNDGPGPGAYHPRYYKQAKF